MACLPAGRRNGIHMEYFVYILLLNDGSFYKGMTPDLEVRLKNHEKGRCYSTRNKLPFKLIYVQPCLSRVEAIKMDKYFKSGFGREIIEEIYAEVAKWYTH